MSISKKQLKEIKTAIDLQDLIDDDSKIDYSDIPEADDDFWKNAILVEKPHKELISLRLDEDVIKYFKKQGKGYQTKINQILRTYVNAKNT